MGKSQPVGINRFVWMVGKASKYKADRESGPHQPPLKP